MSSLILKPPISEKALHTNLEIKLSSQHGNLALSIQTTAQESLIEFNISGAPSSALDALSEALKNPTLSSLITQSLNSGGSKEPVSY